jgi:hypothetical protein
MEQIAADGAACLITLAIALLVMIVLGIRDYRRNVAYEETRPLEDRIQDFEKDAATMIAGLERVAAQPPPPGRDFTWVPPAIDLYRRMEQIANSPTSTPEEALALAKDAREYEREYRVKGVLISGPAENLAALLKRRSRPPDSPA